MNVSLRLFNPMQPADCCHFQILLGDRYGQTAVLRTMPTDDYELFRDVAEENLVKNRHLLQTWYEYDENAVPPVYVFKVHSCYRYRSACQLCCVKRVSFLRASVCVSVCARKN